MFTSSPAPARILVVMKASRGLGNRFLLGVAQMKRLDQLTLPVILRVNILAPIRGFFHKPFLGNLFDCLGPSRAKLGYSLPVHDERIVAVVLAVRVAAIRTICDKRDGLLGFVLLVTLLSRRDGRGLDQIGAFVVEAGQGVLVVDEHAVLHHVG